MASKAASFADVCPVCLETRPLKIVGRCKHRFCMECLMITLGSQEGDVFPCPTCKVDCPRPWDGVKGMVDFTGEDVAVVDPPKGQRGEEKELRQTAEESVGGKLGRTETQDTLFVRCKICHHQKKDVQAVDLCVECGNLYICEECSSVHARNKVTQGHVVVRLRSETKKREAMCKEHDSVLNSYCHDCGKAVCMVCVMLEHGEHTVEKLADVVDEKVEELKEALEEKGKKLEKLKTLKEDLKHLKFVAPIVDRQGILIKEIEDHAQKCIEQITKWKKALKDQVKVHYKIIQDIPVGFEKVAAMVQELQEPIERAGRLLAKTEYDPEYLDKLIALQQDMDAMVNVKGDNEERGYRKHLRELHKKCHSFLPEEIPSSYGSLGSAEKFKWQKIFKHAMQEFPKKTYIPCVANLGKMFAVAHPVKSGKPSVAIDIYEFPGTLKHTLTDHVPPLYDMSSTPDGKLAVLSDGTRKTSCSIKLFDLDTGYVSCTRDIDIAKPLSLGVTLQHQYVILGGNEKGQNIITVVNRDGVVENTLVIDKDFINKNLEEEDLDSDVDSDENIHKDAKGESDEASDADDDSNTGTDTYSNVAANTPKRIACGGRFIFVLRDEIVVVYEITDKEMCKIESFECSDFKTDISATIWDECLVSDIDLDEVWLFKYVKDNVNKCKWELKDCKKLYSKHARRAMISVRDGHVVAGQDRTIRVFKIKESGEGL